MAYITVTNSFSNGTTADASQVNTNFTDLINGTSDGTKDFSISALTCAGTATFNGNVVLGNASGDTVTLTGTLTSATQISNALGSASAPAYSFTGDLNTGMFSSGADALELVTGGTARVALASATATLGSATYPFYIYGRIDGVAPTAGMMGEVFTTGAVQTTFTNTAATNVWGDGGSLALTAGVWLLQSFITFSLNGATATYVQTGISTTSGNSATGLNQYENWAGSAPPTSNADVTVVIPSYTINISGPGTTTYYMKLRAGFSAGTPQWMGSMRAIRIG